MSVKIIASAAIRGAHKFVDKAEEQMKQAIDKFGAEHEVGFPNTAYYLPIIFGMLGHKVEKLKDMEPVIKRCRLLLPPPVKEKLHLPYLGQVLDAGMSTLFAQEVIESIRYLNEPNFYLQSEDVTDDNIWLGAADDVIMRKRGVEFVDGTAPGFAAIVGSAPTKEIAAEMALELQKKNLYVFMASEHNGTCFSKQLVEAGVQIGWNTRLVSFSPDVSGAIFAVGFATRAAMSFGGIEPGDYRKILIYNKDRVFAFVLAMGDVSDEWYATAAGCINYGFPTIADTPIPEILPTGVCTYEHVVSNIPHNEMIAKATEVRGLKVTVAEVPVPVSYGPAFEGERVRGADIYLECGGGRTDMCEWVHTVDMNEINDGDVSVNGPEMTEVAVNEKGKRLGPLAIEVKVAGRKMESDYEPILERQIHHLINYAQGIMHIGQRDIAWLRVGNSAIEKGFKFADIGRLLHAKLHQDFGAVFDKCAVILHTNQDAVTEILAKAREAYKTRDERVGGMKDETTDMFYSCTLCQSFAPSHVCVISPERTGLCGSYNWLDCKASYEINPTGPNQPVEKGEVLDQVLGNFKGVNEFITKASRGNITSYNFYSLMQEPMTTCGCCECIAAVLPMCNGIMTVNREYKGETPCGMKFTTLAGTMGGGISSPGFVGHSKYNITQRKFIAGDGGFQRLVWMPKMLKEELYDRLKVRGEEIGIPNFVDLIADETVGTDEETVLNWLTEKGHPAVTMDSIIG
jgi:acetyl-CoA synthase